MRNVELRFKSFWRLTVFWSLVLGAPIGWSQTHIEGEYIIRYKSSGGTGSPVSGGASEGVSGASSGGQGQRAFRASRLQQKSLGIASRGARVKRQSTSLDVLHVEGVSDSLAFELASDPEVDYIEPNYRLEKLTFNEETVGFGLTGYSASELSELVPAGYEALGNQTSYSSAVPAPGDLIQLAFSTGAVAPSNLDDRPIVAVIDSGLDTQHFAFAQRSAVWRNPNEIPGNGMDDDGNGFVDDVHGWNFISKSGAMIDDDGHGTHVAGIVLSVASDIFDPSDSSASPIQIMPLKFLDANGGGSTADAIAAITYAVDNGAKVINASWGGVHYSRALHEAVAYSYDRGVAFVAAAGNAKRNNDAVPVYPSSLDVPSVLSVAATTDWDYLATFSNWGAQSVGIGSPGVFILSTTPGSTFGYSSGTSMAAPYLAGLAAVSLLVNPNLNGFDLKNLMLNRAQALQQLQGWVATGGRVEFEGVLQSAAAQQPSALPFYSIDGSSSVRSLASAAPEASSSGGGCAFVMPVHLLSGGSGPGPGAGQMGSEFFRTLLFLALAIGSVLLALYSLNKKSAFVEPIAESPMDKRAHERFVLNTGVTLKVGGRELTGTVGTISQGGVSLKTEEWLEKGGNLQMILTSPDGTEKVEVEGRIVWSEPKQAYGVQFVEAKSEVKAAIMGWTKVLSRSTN